MASRNNAGGGSMKRNAEGRSKESNETLDVTSDASTSLPSNLDSETRQAQIPVVDTRHLSREPFPHIFRRLERAADSNSKDRQLTSSRQVSWAAPPMLAQLGGPSKRYSPGVKRRLSLGDDAGFRQLTTGNMTMSRNEEPPLQIEAGPRRKMIRLAPLPREAGTQQQPTLEPELVPQLEARPTRPIVIDGSNVAHERSRGKVFESQAIKVCADYFLQRGFKDVIVVVPEHRLSNRGCDNPKILRDLQEKELLVTSWSRVLPNGVRAASYDDRMIVEIAHKRGGVIVSNDRYRDLYQEKMHWRQTIVDRVLPFRFMPGVPNEIMFPDDPLGRDGPKLDDFLRF